MRRIVIAAYDDAALLDIACPADVFDAATRRGADPPYHVEIASLGGRPVRTTSGITLAATPLERVDGRPDTLIVSGGLGYRCVVFVVCLLSCQRGLAGRSRRVATECTGA